jgi:hypothetical protein
LKTVQFYNIDLRRQYWTTLSDWKPEWLLDEDNMKQWKKGKHYKRMLNRLAIRRSEAMREIESAICDRAVNLNLSSKGLISLPDNICNLTSLTTLRLCRNQLIELPETIGSLTKLTTFNLYENKLSSF